MIIDEMKHNIKAYNCYMTDDKLNHMDIKCLLANCHPIDRRDFAIRLFKLDLITEEEYKNATEYTPLTVYKS